MTTLNVYTVVGVMLMLFTNSCKESQHLFQENTDDWKLYGNAIWKFSNGNLKGEVYQGAGFVLTEKLYKDFILELEFKPDSTINSGVFIRCKTKDINPKDCYEINIWDLHPDKNNRTGAIVTRQAPIEIIETNNKWNRYKIKAEKNHIQVWINNILTTDLEDKSLPEGYIGLQAKGTGHVCFRNVKITTLNESKI